MSMSALLLSSVVLVAPAAEKKAAPVEQRVYLVFQQPKSDAKNFTPMLDKSLRQALGRYQKYQVFTRADMAEKQAVAGDQQQVACQSDSAACLSRLSEGSGADFILSAQWAEIGDVTMLNLTLVEVAEAKVIGRESCTADSHSALLAQVDTSLALLLGLGKKSQAKSIRFKLPEQGGKVAVMPLKERSVKADIASSLTQVVAQEFKNFKGFSVISQDDIKAMLALESDKQLLGCDDVSCIAEIGGALGVDYLVTGTVGQVGDTFLVWLKLIDIRQAKVLNRVSESFKGEASDLLRATKFATYQLVGLEHNGVGTLRVQLVPNDALLSIDAHRQVAVDSYKLGAGRHSLLVEADGYQSSYLETYVEAGKINTLHITLEEVPTPWYAQWWAITTGSAVLLSVSAGTAIAVAMLLGDSTPATQGSVGIAVSRDAP